MPFATPRNAAAFKLAKDALDDFAEKRRAVVAQQASYKIGDLWGMWLAEREADKLDNSVYKANWTSLGPVFTNVYPANLSTQMCRNYARARFDLGRSAWTVNTELTRLNTCLKWAFDTHKITRRPKVWVPSPGESRDRVLSVEEARALILGAKSGDPHIYVFVMLLFATGARHRAILDLTWDRIDWGCYPDEGDQGDPRPGIIDFDDPLPPDPMSKRWRKGRATVPMNAMVRAALKDAYAARQTDHVVEHGGRRLKDCREGFYSAVKRAGIGDWIDKVADDGSAQKAFVTDVTPHTIRHTVITLLDAKKVDDNRRAQLAGHSDVNVTKKVYTHAAAHLLTEAVQILGAEFAPLPKLTHSVVKSAPDESSPRVGLSQRDKPAKRNRSKKRPRYS